MDGDRTGCSTHGAFDSFVTHGSIRLPSREKVNTNVCPFPAPDIAPPFLSFRRSIHTAGSAAVMKPPIYPAQATGTNSGSDAPIRQNEMRPNGRDPLELLHHDDFVQASTAVFLFGYRKSVFVVRKVGRQEGSNSLAARANHLQLPCPRKTEAVFGVRDNRSGAKKSARSALERPSMRPLYSKGAA